MATKYGFLTTAAKIFKILSWVVGVVVGIVVPIAILITGGTPDVPRVASLGWLVIGAFQFLWLMTISNIISLLLDLAGGSQSSGGIS